MRKLRYWTYYISALNLVLLIVLLVCLAAAAIAVLGRWKVFRKAGEEGWKALIPFYSEFTLFHLAWADKYFWLWLGLIIGIQLSRSLLGIIGGLLSLFLTVALGAVTWVSRVRLATAFGKDRGFAAGLFLAGPVFMLVLAFGSARYQGADPTPIEDTIPAIKPYKEKIERKLRS